MTAIAEVAAFPDPLVRARAGDHEAFATLVREHQSMVFSIAWRFFRDRDRADELAQDVFLQLYRCLGDIESSSHLTHWLRQVTSRRCIDQTRRARLRPVALDEAGELQTAAAESDPFLQKKLQELVADLPPLQRLMVTLRYQEDLDPSEIGGIVQMPVNTVKSHLHRAIVALRNKLRKDQ